MGRAQLKAAGVTLRVIARAEREELAFQLIRGGKGITLAPHSLVPDDLMAVPVSGLSVSRVIGLQWRVNLDPLLRGIVIDAMTDQIPALPALSETNRKLKRTR